MVMNEYEWVEGRLTPALKFREQHPAVPIAFFTEPGRGHFDYSDGLVDFLARFIRKAVEARMETSGALKPVDPHDGWLVQRGRPNVKPSAAAAPFAKFSGDKNDAFWTFDRELARLTEKFSAMHGGKQPQLLGFIQDGKIIPQTDTHYQVALKFEPQADGVTFRMATTFLDSVDGGSKNCARWTGLPAGSPLGHAPGGTIRLSRITGPVEQLSADTFALRFNRISLPADPRAGDLWLLAEHPGDATFKSIVQQALLKIPLRLDQGAEQRITFSEIPDVKAGTKTVKLHATSDSGATVYFYVREGAAEMAGDTLRLTQLPPRTKFPVRVTVVAWQYGRSTEPKLKTAEPVERTFFITQPAGS
jgi:hypothetical protein